MNLLIMATETFQVCAYFRILRVLNFGVSWGGVGFGVFFLLFQFFVNIFEMCYNVHIPVVLEKSRGFI